MTLHREIDPRMNPFLISYLVAAATTTATGNGGTPSNPMGQMIMMIGLMAVAFWLIIMRPQKREQSKRQQMLDNTKKGDRVVTIGGIHGWVTEVDKAGRTVSVRIDTKTVIKVDRSAIARIEGPEAEEPPAPETQK